MAAIDPPARFPDGGLAGGAAAWLRAGEAVLASCRLDLDADGRFAAGRMVLTNGRLLVQQPIPSDPPAPVAAWDLDDAATLVVTMGTAFGRLTLLRPGLPDASWLFTAARAAEAHGLAVAWQERHRRQGGLTGAEQEPTAAADPRWGDEAEAAGGAGSWRPLVRVLGFARGHAGMAALGCFLSLASTAMALVPPYVTMPLVDRVLIPRQSGQDVPFRLVWWYLGLLAAAAVISWLLSWARSWTLAWVSERIAADLRARTYAHMQGLSLDFFAVRRTGDLISRVSSDTERINNFLSMHLIDFSSNVLLVVLTAGVLVRHRLG
jgi:ATP-binding cassette subfamily B protein